MKIKKYIKQGLNKYKVVLEDNTSIVLYEDIILKYELLLKKEISNLDTILKENNKYELYDKCLNYLNKKLRSESEIKKYLQKYTSNQLEIDNIINKLKENNYLNNKLYIKSYINDKFYLTLEGPTKIKKDLINLELPENDILDELTIFNQEVIKERIEKYLTKQERINKKNLYTFKNKMLLNLLNLGYLKEDIMSYLDNISFDDTSLKEKEYTKLKLKYSKKYSGYELEQVIKRKLYEKGYRD